jgi:hypothetical protein
MLRYPSDGPRSSLDASVQPIGSPRAIQIQLHILHDIETALLQKLLVTQLVEKATTGAVLEPRSSEQPINAPKRRSRLTDCFVWRRDAAGGGIRN